MSGGLGAWLMGNALDDFWLADRLKQAVDIDTKVFALADQLAVERANVDENLQADQPADASARSRIDDIRATAERVLHATEQRLTALANPGARRQLDIIRQAYAELAAWRDRIDGMLLLTRADRESDIIAAHSHVFDATYQALDRAFDAGDTDALHHAGTALELVGLARRVSLLHGLIAARTGALQRSFDDETGLREPAASEALARSDGAVALCWGLVDAAVRRLPGMPEVATALAAAHTAFDRLQELQVGKPAPPTGSEAGKVAVQVALKLLSVRDVALATVRARVAGRRQQAAFVVGLVATCLLLIGAATLLVMQVMQRRVVAPVVSLIRVIDRLAQGDYKLTVPLYRSSDEIGRMATSIEALRQGAVAAETSKAQVAFMAHHDALTNLPNRVLFQERVEQAIALCGRGQRCAVLCLDLDRFKAVNDGFGHPVGDLLLQAVAERLLACVREVDTVTRLGGDEFAVLMHGLDHPERAGLLAKRVVDTLSEPYELSGHTIVVGASVGIAIAPEDATSTVKLMKSADTALYRAKSEERGTYRYFEAEMDARLQARMALERDLRVAVRNEDFELAFQPLYNVLENTLICFEALLRWNHPVRGVIHPVDFIPVAEETGLIVPLGAWVLKEACAQATTWPDEINVAVNLSAVQFRHRSLVETVRHALKETNLSSHRLDLEITESVLLHNSEETLQTLHEIRALGVRISMDDFGTGYSSLSYLRSFPFDRIKIDKSFVRDMSDQEDSIAIVRAVVGLGRSLGMITTAEGVETEAQLSQLRREGCTEVQGYLFSRPTSADTAHRLAWGKAAGLLTEGEAQTCG